MNLLAQLIGVLSTSRIMNSMQFAFAFPELAQEITDCLLRRGETELAGQIEHISIVDKCRCGDSFCGSLRTSPKPKGAYGPGHRNVVLEPSRGMFILDVVDERIVYIEILYRDEIKQRVDLLLP